MDINECCFPVLILEKSSLFHRLITHFCQQSDGANGPFVLSEKWESIDIGKSVYVLTDLFHIDLNGRKQSSFLMKELNSLAVSERHFHTTISVQDTISRWIFDLENDLPFALVHNDSVDYSAIIKCMGIRFNDNTTVLLEKLINYIKISAAYMHAKLLVLVGLHANLENEALQEFYKTAIYEKLPIIDIERYMPDHKLPCEKVYIVDRDDCEIYNDPDDIP